MPREAQPGIWGRDSCCGGGGKGVAKSSSPESVSSPKLRSFIALSTASVRSFMLLACGSAFASTASS